MNAVVPLALCLQVALAGKMAGSSVQAAFGLVVVTCGMGTTVFSFLVDGVVAKVGTAIGACPVGGGVTNKCELVTGCSDTKENENCESGSWVTGDSGSRKIVSGISNNFNFTVAVPLL